jgi:uncharacterized repeat protein (TIGR03843 family)
VLSETEALDLLRHGTLDIEGRLVDASNTTLRCVITMDGVEARCVYKPVRGERPLWDFPDGTLAGREVSAYLMGAATGWSPVPPTVLRDGPLGPGACQLWIETTDSDDEADDLPDAPDSVVGFVPAGHIPFGWHRIMAAQDEDGSPYVLVHADDDRLARLAAFDVVINNADRKGGHILVSPSGALYGVDHGVSFHVETKLRTILWGWVGDLLPDETVEVLRKLRVDLGGALGDSLHEHLTIAEVNQVGRRIDRLLKAGIYPKPSDGWPAVPWPPV